MMTSEQIYREGAYKGVAMGIYLSIASLFMLAGNGTVLSLVALAMLIGVPFFQHRLMLAAYKKHRCATGFAGLWLLGIVVFIGASLICAAATYAYLAYINPNFIDNSLLQTAELYRQSPELQQTDFFRGLSIAIENGLTFSAADFCIEMILLTIFSGSILSILLALLIKNQRVKQY